MSSGLLAVAPGIAGFLLMFPVDLLMSRGRHGQKTAFFLGGGALVLASIVLLVAFGSPLAVPVGARVVGWVLVGPMLLLMAYSLLVEIPLASLYLGRAPHPPLVTSGTYALTRHPGVLWFTLFLLSLALAAGSRSLLVATPLLVLMDVLHVWFQERMYLLPVYGEEYRRYQRFVPMLVPTPRSLKRALATVGFWRQGAGPSGRRE